MLVDGVVSPLFSTTTPFPNQLINYQLRAHLIFRLAASSSSSSRAKANIAIIAIMGEHANRILKVVHA